MKLNKVTKREMVANIELASIPEICGKVSGTSPREFLF